MTNLDSKFKSRDITLPTKVRLVKAMVFPVVMYGCESWTVEKADHKRIDAFELWCWRRLLRVPWIARRSNQSIIKEISPGCSLEGLMLKLKLHYFGHLMRRTDSLEKTLMLGKIEGWRRKCQPTPVFLTENSYGQRSLSQSVESLSCVQLFVTPQTAAHQASLSITNSQSLLKHMALESVMPSNHLILCCSLLLLPSIFPSIRVVSNQSVLHLTWPKYWSFSFNISLPSEYSGLISFRMDWLDLLAVQGTLNSLLRHHSSKASVLHY